jgi:hypothetical protein
MLDSQLLKLSGSFSKIALHLIFRMENIIALFSQIENFSILLINYFLLNFQILLYLIVNFTEISIFISQLN